MKIFLILGLCLYSSLCLACSCEYDYGSRSLKFMDRAAALIGDIQGKELKIIRYNVEYTALGYVDPTSYGRRSCGCTSFVKRVWDLGFEKNGAACEAKVILQVWNNKMKLKNVNCQ
jgi:hypothetical protein